MGKSRKVQNQDKEHTWLDHIRIDEELANARKINEWLLPLLKSDLINKPLKDTVLLSVGCGFGADVDTLADVGVNAYGVEPFARTQMWHLRRNKGRLVAADGRKLPFKNETFDVVYCAAVIEHVGYEGQENAEANMVWEERGKFAKELSRVLKPRGVIILNTWNRHFCIDSGHGANFLGVRVHSPFNDFTLSFRDIESLFVQKCGCTSIATLPYKSFITWDLLTKNYPLIRRLSPLVKIYLRLLDRLKFLRSSFLSPYLILAINK
ncbi:class I SAM-dependent methyltransferase [Chloroflexota bacterium]